MADPLLSFPISCHGGLDETSTTRQLESKPGWARSLYNFEVTQDGGYRRVNGYEKLGTAGKTPDLTESPILGALVYNNGFLFCKGDRVYFTYDGNDWATINRDTDPANNPDGVNKTTLDTKPLIPRTGAGFYHFEEFLIGTKQILIGVCPGRNPFYLEISGTQMSNSKFLYKELTITQGSLSGANRAIKYKDQLVIAGMSGATTEIYYSDILKPDDFEGANAGTIGFNDTVTGIRLFREAIYVFCRNSIHKVVGIETGTPSRVTVTSQLGCVDGDSIQELAGDLVFLAPDGLRTLAATERIADINISTLSDPIQNRLRRATQEIDKYKVRSVVIRNKAQYRIFFKASSSGVSRPPFALSMFIGKGEQGGLQPQFSELGGFDIEAIHSGYVGVTETVVSGDGKGNIYYHDRGITQDGRDISFSYSTPYFDMGDNLAKKNLHKIITRIIPEGTVNFNLLVQYDYEDPKTYQPQAYPLVPIDKPSVYDEGLYGTSSYGDIRFPAIETLTEGSGRTVSLTIFPNGLRCDPFAIQGFDIRFVPAGKL